MTPALTECGRTESGCSVESSTSKQLVQYVDDTSKQNIKISQHIDPGLPSSDVAIGHPQTHTLSAAVKHHRIITALSSSTAVPDRPIDCLSVRSTLAQSAHSAIHLQQQYCDDRFFTAVSPQRHQRTYRTTSAFWKLVVGDLFACTASHFSAGVPSLLSRNDRV